MDTLLKTLRHPIRRNTIRGDLLHYALNLMLSMLFCVAALVGAYSLSTLSETRENRTLFLVNDFYTGIQDQHARLYTVIVSDHDEAYPQLIASCAALSASLEEIAQVRISGAFRRDIEDLACIMDSYMQQLEAIARHAGSSGDISPLSQMYTEATAMVRAINGTFHTVYAQIVDSFQRHAQRMARIRAGYLAVFFLIAALLVRHLISQLRDIETRVTAPVQQLIDELKTLDLDHLRPLRSMEDASASNSDVALLIHVYHAMLEKIDKQLREREELTATRLQLQEQELLNLQISNELKKTQLTNLQAQINPHFLFNTLNMIAYSAHLEDDRHTVSLLETTSDLLRYALDYSDKTVPLEMEMQHLGDYVYLQEQRFGDRIRFYFDLDESFFKTQVPNFILQPLVENAIAHGVGMYTEGGEIIIRTEYHPETQMGQISIIDNGLGMSPETIARVDQQMRERKQGTGKVGLCNVFFRLSLFFDCRADIRLSSEPNVRTEIAVFIPCDPESSKARDFA